MTTKSNLITKRIATRIIMNGSSSISSESGRGGKEEQNAGKNDDRDFRPGSAASCGLGLGVGHGPKSCRSHTSYSSEHEPESSEASFHFYNGPPVSSI
jgi:hypothetical protein